MSRQSFQGGVTLKPYAGRIEVACMNCPESINLPAMKADRLRRVVTTFDEFHGCAPLWMGDPAMTPEFVHWSARLEAGDLRFLRLAGGVL